MGLVFALANNYPLFARAKTRPTEKLAPNILELAATIWD